MQPWIGANANVKGNLYRLGLSAVHSLKTTTIKVGLTLKAMALRPFQLMRSAYNALKSPRRLLTNMKTKLAKRFVRQITYGGLVVASSPIVRHLVEMGIANLGQLPPSPSPARI